MADGCLPLSPVYVGEVVKDDEVEDVNLSKYESKYFKIYWLR